jgi:hypothetical protein
LLNYLPELDVAPCHFVWYSEGLCKRVDGVPTFCEMLHRRALLQKSEIDVGCAKGAEYESQGQALSRAKRVAPGDGRISFPALKERNNSRNVIQIALSALLVFTEPIQGRRASLCSALAPGFHIRRLWRWEVAEQTLEAMLFCGINRGNPKRNHRVIGRRLSLSSLARLTFEIGNSFGLTT